MFHRTPNFFPRSNKRVFRVQGTHLGRNNCKIKQQLSGVVARRLYFFQKRTTFWPKFPSWGIWPIYLWLCSFATLSVDHLDSSITKLVLILQLPNHLDSSITKLPFDHFALVEEHCQLPITNYQSLNYQITFDHLALVEQHWQLLPRRFVCIHITLSTLAAPMS